MGTSNHLYTSNSCSLLPFLPECSHWDTLTGLADRQYILKSLQIWLSRSDIPAVTVVLFNVENFKLVNRCVGHRIGDRWLCAIARRLQSQAGAYGLVGRLNGDEFLLIDCDPHQRQADVPKMACEVAVALSEPVAVAGKVMERKVNSSFSSSHGRAVSAEKLFSEAEKRMRNLRQRRIRSPDEMLYRSAEYADLQRAIEAGRQIEVYYQPEVDLQTGFIVGVEALARWHHPRKGAQPASNFIALAERTGLVVPLSWLVLHRALSQMMVWRQRFAQLSLTIRVNASPLQIMREGFASEVLKALSFHKLPPSVLCIEVTEHQVMQCEAVVVAELQLLRDQGVSIALDDFGTGHSSLSRLREMPADCLKIDRSFVKACDESGRKLSVLEMIKQLADAFELLVVVEGIESERELSELRKVGFERGQGSLFSLALPAEEIEKNFTRSFLDESISAAKKDRQGTVEKDHTETV